MYDSESIRDIQLKTVMESRAFKERTHPRHEYAVAKFLELHGIEKHPYKKDPANENYSYKQSRLDEITQDPAFTDKMDIRHKELISEFHNLHKETD